MLYTTTRPTLFFSVDDDENVKVNIYGIEHKLDQITYEFLDDGRKWFHDRYIYFTIVDNDTVLIMKRNKDNKIEIIYEGSYTETK
jgi:hypothetical protein